MVDNQWFSPKRVMLISHPRAGSTLLAALLDAHPDIGFERGEPLSPKIGWPTDWQLVFHLMFHKRYGYKVVGLRATYKSLKPDMWAWFREHEVSIIHLRRENLLRVLVSAQIATHQRDQRPLHTFQRVSNLVRVELPIPSLIQKIEKITQVHDDAAARMSGHNLNVFDLTYEDIVKREGWVISQVPGALNVDLTRWLGLTIRPLTTSLKRTNPFRLSEIIYNWQEVQDALTGTPYEKWLEE